jgi:predicted transcriptional regulator
MSKKDYSRTSVLLDDETKADLDFLMGYYRNDSASGMVRQAIAELARRVRQEVAVSRSAATGTR